MCFFIAKGGIIYCRRGQIEVTQLIKIALIDGIVLTSAVEQLIPQKNLLSPAFQVRMYLPQVCCYCTVVSSNEVNVLRYCT